MEFNNENLKTIFEKLENFFKTETVIGQPLQVGETTLIPIIDITFGLASGGGTGRDTKGNDGVGGGAGAGAKIAPNSILVIKNGEVSIITLKDKGSLERVLEMVPEIIGKVSDKMGEKKESEQPTMV